MVAEGGVRTEAATGLRCEGGRGEAGQAEAVCAAWPERQVVVA